MIRSVVISSKNIFLNISASFNKLSAERLSPKPPVGLLATFIRIFITTCIPSIHKNSEKWTNWMELFCINQVIIENYLSITKYSLREPDITVAHNNCFYWLPVSLFQCTHSKFLIFKWYYPLSSYIKFISVFHGMLQMSILSKPRRITFSSKPDLCLLLM